MQASGGLIGTIKSGLAAAKAYMAKPASAPARLYPSPWELPGVTEDEVGAALTCVRTISGGASSTRSQTRRTSGGSTSRSPKRRPRRSADAVMSGAL